MPDSLFSQAEREQLLAARVRLSRLPPERIVDAQTAPVGPIKSFLEALDGDAATAHAAVLAFIKAVNALCDGVHRKEGRVNRSAVEAAEDGFDALANLFALPVDAVAELRALRDARAAERHLDVAAIDATVRARATARHSRDFDTADRLHAELTAQGIIIDDGVDGDWTLR